MSHKKFYTILGLGSLGCGILSVLSVLLSALDKVWRSSEAISLVLFGVVFLLYISMVYFSWPYAEKHVVGWKGRHALGILPIGIIPGILPWVIIWLCVQI